MIDPLYARLGAYAALDEADFSPLRDAAFEPAAYDRGAAVIEIAAALTHVFVVAQGWAIRYRLLEDGRRQIVNVMLPGDCFDLQAMIAAKADHGVEAVTALDVMRAPKARFIGAIRANGRLATAFWWTAVQEESILREQIVRLGRRSGRARIAHLFLELQRRRTLAGLAGGDLLPMPLTRDMLADMLGLSPVHVSRSLSALKRAKLIALHGGGVVLLDRRGLAALAQFDPAYLHADAMARLA